MLTAAEEHICPYSAQLHSHKSLPYGKQIGVWQDNFDKAPKITCWCWIKVWREYYLPSRSWCQVAPWAVILGSPNGPNQQWFWCILQFNTKLLGTVYMGYNSFSTPSPTMTYRQHLTIAFKQLLFPPFGKVCFRNLGGTCFLCFVLDKPLIFPCYMIVGLLQFIFLLLFWWCVLLPSLLTCLFQQFDVCTIFVCLLILCWQLLDIFIKHPSWWWLEVYCFATSFWIRNWYYIAKDRLLRLVVGVTLFKKTLRVRHLKLDREEIWQNCSSNNYASIDGVEFLLWRHTFKMSVMTSYPLLVAAH